MKLPKWALSALIKYARRPGTRHIYLPEWLANALIERSHATPFRHLAGYMDRYWLVSPKSDLAKELGHDVRIHKILRSDLDRDTHDHPWPYTTVILENGYSEVVEFVEFRDAWTWFQTEGSRHRGDRSITLDADRNRWQTTIRYRRGDVLHRSATFSHRLIMAGGGSATTMFIMGEKVNSWGFITPAGKVPYAEYLDPVEVAAQREAVKQAYGEQDGAQ